MISSLAPFAGPAPHQQAFRRSGGAQPWRPRLWALVALLGMLLPQHRALATQTPRDIERTLTPAISHPMSSPTGAPVLGDDVVLRVPGNSRFAATVYGRDTVVAHLQAMGIRWESLRAIRPLASLAPNEDVWLAAALVGAESIASNTDPRATPFALVSATRNTSGEIATLDVFIHNETLLARRAPRDDGVLRTSLAAQRNLRHVRALHGNGRATRFLGANGARVLVILHAQQHGPPQIVEYRFDALGHVVSLHSVPPSCASLREPCCRAGIADGFTELLAIIGPLD